MTQRTRNWYLCCGAEAGARRLRRSFGLSGFQALSLALSFWGGQHSSNGSQYLHNGFHQQLPKWVSTPLPKKVSSVLLHCLCRASRSTIALCSFFSTYLACTKPHSQLACCGVSTCVLCARCAVLLCAAALHDDTATKAPEHDTNMTTTTRPHGNNTRR